MHTEQAEHTLETIRTLMERSQRYEHITGYAALIAGGAVLAGAGMLMAHCLPFGAHGSFAVVWGTVFLVALAGHSLGTFARARQRGEPVWSRQARTVYLAILPSLIAAAVVTGVLWRLDKLDWAPALWLVFYGCGTLATGFFAPRSITWLGAACLTVGLLSLILGANTPNLTMAIGFGLTHVAFGVCVLVADRREARQRAFWREIEQLAQTE